MKRHTFWRLALVFLAVFWTLFVWGGVSLVEKANAGSWMGWPTYCATHPHFAKTHPRIC